MNDFDLSNHIHKDNFSTIDAALLWYEIEPSPERRENPPAKVANRDALIQEFAGKLFRQETREQLGLGLTSETFQKDMALIERHLAHQNKLMRLGAPTQKGIERFYEMFFLNTPLSCDISRENLKKVALLLGEKPRFLFPDDKPEIAWSGVSRLKYNEFAQVLNVATKSQLTLDEFSTKIDTQNRVKAVIQNSGLDPLSRQTAGTLATVAQKNGIVISDKTIRSIFNEIYPERSKRKP